MFDLEARDTSPATARAELRRFLGADTDAAGTDLLLGDAAVVVSELVTNAVMHGDPPIQLRLRWTPACLRIEVLDGAPDTDAIAPQPQGAHAERGRGLQILAVLAEEWGVARDGVGKIVWAELPWPREGAG